MHVFVYLQQSAFSQWVRESGSVLAYPTILLLHTYGMAVLVGIVAVIDLRILGFAMVLPLAPLKQLVPILWVAFWVNAVTGTILFASDAPAKATNLDFGVKMAFIALAVVSQRLIERRVFRGAPLDTSPFARSAKMLAALSLIFWLGAITAGRLLAYLGSTGTPSAPS